MLLVCHFTHKTWKRVDLFPILTTNDSSIFLSNSVNHGQGSMCLKFKPLFLYKQHPSPEVKLHTLGSSWCLGNLSQKVLVDPWDWVFVSWYRHEIGGLWNPHQSQQQATSQALSWSVQSKQEQSQAFHIDPPSGTAQVQATCRQSGHIVQCGLGAHGNNVQCVQAECQPQLIARHCHKLHDGLFLLMTENWLLA